MDPKRLPGFAGALSPKIAALLCLFICAAIFLCFRHTTGAAADPAKVPVRTFRVRGVIRKLMPAENVLVVSHEAIGTYMDAMTMPFKTRPGAAMEGLHVGDSISFRLSVAEDESWVDHITRLSTPVILAEQKPTGPEPARASASSRHPLLSYAFTNELGQPMTLGSFKGQALAITFFFTRCPLPDFCPRLSKNFAEASRKLSSMPDSPTNWHFLSVSFDPEFDTPAVLKAYGEKYQYNPARWSFLTGPKDKILELARLSNVQVEPDNGLLNHNFRTMIIDAAGRLQMIFPIGGDLSDAIVSEMLKAAVAGTNRAS